MNFKFSLMTMKDFLSYKKVLFVSIATKDPVHALPKHAITRTLPFSYSPISFTSCSVQTSSSRNKDTSWWWRDGWEGGIGRWGGGGGEGGGGSVVWCWDFWTQWFRVKLTDQRKPVTDGPIDRQTDQWTNRRNRRTHPLSEIHGRI